MRERVVFYPALGPLCIYGLPDNIVPADSLSTFRYQLKNCSSSPTKILYFFSDCYCDTLSGPAVVAAT